MLEDEKQPPDPDAARIVTALSWGCATIIAALAISAFVLIVTAALALFHLAARLW